MEKGDQQKLFRQSSCIKNTSTKFCEGLWVLGVISFPNGQHSANSSGFHECPGPSTMLAD